MSETPQDSSLPPLESNDLPPLDRPKKKKVKRTVRRVKKHKDDGEGTDGETKKRKKVRKKVKKPKHDRQHQHDHQPQHQHDDENTETSRHEPQEKKHQSTAKSQEEPQASPKSEPSLPETPSDEPTVKTDEAAFAAPTTESNSSEVKSDAPPPPNDESSRFDDATKLSEAQNKIKELEETNEKYAQRIKDDQQRMKHASAKFQEMRQKSAEDKRAIEALKEKLGEQSETMKSQMEDAQEKMKQEALKGPGSLFAVESKYITPEHEYSNHDLFVSLLADSISGSQELVERNKVIDIDSPETKHTDLTEDHPIHFFKELSHWKDDLVISEEELATARDPTIASEMANTTKTFTNMKEANDFDVLATQLEEKCSFVASSLARHPLPDSEWSQMIQSNLIEPVEEIMSDTLGIELVEKENSYHDLKAECEQLKAESVELRKRGEDESDDTLLEEAIEKETELRDKLVRDLLPSVFKLRERIADPNFVVNKLVPILAVNRDRSGKQLGKQTEKYRQKIGECVADKQEIMNFQAKIEDELQHQMETIQNQTAEYTKEQNALRDLEQKHLNELRALVQRERERVLQSFTITMEEEKRRRALHHFSASTEESMRLLNERTTELDDLQSVLDSGEKASQVVIDILSFGIGGTISILDGKLKDLKKRDVNLQRDFIELFCQAYVDIALQEYQIAENIEEQQQDRDALKAKWGRAIKRTGGRKQLKIVRNLNKQLEQVDEDLAEYHDEMDDLRKQISQIDSREARAILKMNEIPHPDEVMEKLKSEEKEQSSESTPAVVGAINRLKAVIIVMRRAREDALKTEKIDKLIRAVSDVIPDDVPGEFVFEPKMRHISPTTSLVVEHDDDDGHSAPTPTTTPRSFVKEQKPQRLIFDQLYSKFYANPTNAADEMGMGPRHGADEVEEDDAEEIDVQQPPIIAEPKLSHDLPKIELPSTESQAQTEPEAQAGTEPEAQVETEPEAQAETEPEAQAETEPETQVETEPETQVETEPEVDFHVESGAEVETKLEATSEAESDAKPQAETQEAEEELQPIEVISKSDDSLRFTVGEFEAVLIVDDSGPQPLDFFFRGATDEDELIEALATFQTQLSNDNTSLKISYSLLYIKTPENQILIDTGIGRYAQSFGVLQASQLTSKLSREGIVAEEIDTIILTHAHLDHIGGILTEENDLVFPNATVVLGAAELALWSSDSPKLCCFALGTSLEEGREGFAKTVQTTLSTISTALGEQKIRTVTNEEEEIVKGVKVRQMKGHTDGSLWIEITSNHQRILAVGDAVFHPLYFNHPDWGVAFHHHPVKSRQNLYQIIDTIVDQPTFLFATHFPFPCLGTLRNVVSEKSLSHQLQWNSL